MALKSPSLASPAHQMCTLGDSPGSSMFKIRSITCSFLCTWSPSSDPLLGERHLCSPSRPSRPLPEALPLTSPKSQGIPSIHSGSQTWQLCLELWLRCPQIYSLLHKAARASFLNANVITSSQLKTLQCLPWPWRKSKLLKLCSKAPQSWPLPRAPDSPDLNTFLPYFASAALPG